MVSSKQGYWAFLNIVCFFADLTDVDRAITIWWQYNMYFVNPFLHLFNCFASKCSQEINPAWFFFKYCIAWRTLTNV